jgi:release factor glutamine methyltransferase
MSETWTVLRLLTWCREYFTGKGIDTPRLDAEVLLASVLGVDRVGLYLRFDQPASADELQRFRELVRRRANREPVAHLVGTKEFYGVSFLADARALVPRPETETLVEYILAALPADALTFADVGVGGGCVALTLLKQRPAWRAVAVDVSPDALALAQANAERLGVTERVRFVHGSLLDGVTEDLAAVVSNPPYVPSAECDTAAPEVAHDPRVAIDGGPDGLEVIRPLVDQAATKLPAGGLLALEIGAGQDQAVLALLERDGRYERGEVRRDLAGIARVIGARKKES